ncbi:MAG: hypothetical protein ACI9G1_005783, partial [Pirellulaceae bacterium]
EGLVDRIRNRGASKTRNVIRPIVSTKTQIS